MLNSKHFSRNCFVALSIFKAMLSMGSSLINKIIVAEVYSNAYKSAVGDKTKVAQEARKAYPI